MSWHLDHELARRYAGGAAGAVLGASVEQHLLACARCRSLLDAHVEPARLDRVWTAVVERVEAPRPRLLERLLGRLGVDASTARLVAVTPSLRGAWLTAVVVVLALALGAAHSTPGGVAVFLALAPVLPLLGVAFAFGPHADPGHEVVAAAPYPVFRLLAVRTACVVATTLLPAAVVAALLPGAPWLAVGWLLPALAMTTATVALAARVPAHLAAFGLSGLWLALVLGALVRDHDSHVAGTPAVQVTSLVALVVAGALLVTHREDVSEQLRRTR